MSPCVRCGLIAKLDHCGYCIYCQWELAHERVYINWAKFGATWEAKGWTWKGGGKCSQSSYNTQA